MTFETLYLILNASVAPAWAMLVFLPRAAYTHMLVHSALYPLVLGGVYVASLGAAIVLGQSHPDASMATLPGVSALFSHPNGVITGWTHYLVFDLFVGAWIGRDAQRRGVPHLAAVPCLLLTFIFGPVGLMLYLLVRLGLKKGGASLFEDEPPRGTT